MGSISQAPLIVPVYLGEHSLMRFHQRGQQIRKHGVHGGR